MSMTKRDTAGYLGIDTKTLTTGKNTNQIFTKL